MHWFNALVEGMNWNLSVKGTSRHPRDWHSCYLHVKEEKRCMTEPKLARAKPPTAFANYSLHSGANRGAHFPHKEGFLPQPSGNLYNSGPQNLAWAFKILIFLKYRVLKKAKNSECRVMWICPGLISSPLPAWFLMLTPQRDVFCKASITSVPHDFWMSRNIYSTQCI